MNRVWTLSALVLCGWVAACGSSGDGGTSATGGTGGAATGGTGAGPAGGSGGSPGATLFINAATGLSTIDKPFADEGKAAIGTIHMEYAKEDLSTAVVKVNDTSLKLLQIGGSDVEATFDLASSLVVGPGPSGSFKASATYKAMSATGTLPCPAGVAITSPAEGAQYAIGDAIIVTWTGSVATDHPLFTSQLKLLGYDSATNLEYGSPVFQPSSDGVVVKLMGTETGGALKAYQPTGTNTGTFDGWVVQVEAVGTYVDETSIAGYCSAISRIHLAKK